MRRNEIIGISVALVIFATVVSLLILKDIVITAQAIEITILFVLVLVTILYAKRTSDIADATREQAKEMREQTVMASRPVIIQKAVVETETELRTFGSLDYFAYFEIYNAGNGPAIELEISLLNKEKNQIQSERKTFLRANEPPIRFDPSDLMNIQEPYYYLVSEYQGILSRGLQKIWYQTWLPFEVIGAGKVGEIYVIAGELEFKEVTEKERIDAFSSRSKPK